MCPERRIFFLHALWRGVGRRAGVRASVRASVRPAWPPPFLDPKKRQKQFKINGLGTFDGTPLAPLLARMCFYDPPLMA